MRNRIRNLTIADIEVLLENAEYTRKRHEKEIESLKEKLSDAERLKELYRNQLIAEKDGTAKQLRELKEKIDNIDSKVSVVKYG